MGKVREHLCINYTHKFQFVESYARVRFPFSSYVSPFILWTLRRNSNIIQSNRNIRILYMIQCSVFFFSKVRFRAHTMPYYIPTDRMYRRKIKHTLSHKHSNSSTFSTLKSKHTWNRIHKSKSVTTMCHFFFRLYFNCAIYFFSSMKIQN